LVIQNEAGLKGVAVHQIDDEHQDSASDQVPGPGTSVARTLPGAGYINSRVR
jgi:hypothetical protein